MSYIAIYVAEMSLPPKISPKLSSDGNDFNLITINIQIVWNCLTFI